MKLFIAIPCYGGMMTALTAKSLMGLVELCTQRGLSFNFFSVMNEALVPRARNYCVEEFLKSDATHLMFIDSDIVFDAESVLELLGTDKDIVGGAYPKKHIAWNKVIEAVQKGENPSENTSDLVGNEWNHQTKECIEVAYLGTGFMLVKREVFEDLRTPDRKYAPEIDVVNQIGIPIVYTYFDTGIVDGRYLSEDYKFCYDVRKMGRKVYLCPWIKLNHVGIYIY